MKTILTPEEKRVREILISVASNRSIIHYTELCRKATLKLDMGIPADRGKIGNILGEISSYEHELGRPLLSSVVVSVNGEQGDGFFKLAEELGYGDWEKLKRGREFEYNMMNATHDFWAAIEREVKEELDIHGLTIEDITTEELEKLREEIEVKSKGMHILDGVLAFIPPYRNLKRKTK